MYIRRIIYDTFDKKASTRATLLLLYDDVFALEQESLFVRRPFDQRILVEEER